MTARRETGRCGKSHRFARIPGARAATAWCGKPAGHSGAHEGVVGTTAYCWRDADGSEQL